MIMSPFSRKIVLLEQKGVGITSRLSRCVDFEQPSNLHPGLALGSSGEIVVTQTPAALQNNLEGIQCKASSYSDMYFYQLIPGQKPKLLIDGATSCFERTPDGFSGRGSGTDFTFAINGVRPEDEGEYYCGQHYSTSLQILAGLVTQPTSGSKDNKHKW
uniref:Immunoglobulin V-set domain-containing protein n=1 Tax=Anolis carolinensis TaxID=28377 RepID=A0A803T3Y0_ANOCA